jgi:hypothetical protein
VDQAAEVVLLIRLAQVVRVLQDKAIMVVRERVPRHIQVVVEVAPVKWGSWVEAETAAL